MEYLEKIFHPNGLINYTSNNLVRCLSGKTPNDSLLFYYDQITRVRLSKTI